MTGDKKIFLDTMKQVNTALTTLGGKKDPHLLIRYVIGEMFMESSYDPHDLSNNNIEWATDYFVAQKIGPLWPRLLQLHQFLVSAGTTPKNPYNFEHCDRYGCAFADFPVWKSMALQTQNYTYLVILRRHPLFRGDGEQCIQEECYATHLRICTTSRDSLDFHRPTFQSLDFLRDHEKVYPEVGYGENAHEYFAYKDGRDRGYLCSVEPNLLGFPQFETKDSLYNFGYLRGVVFDLASHCDCLGDYRTGA